jgi:hypothetical protein
VQRPMTAAKQFKAAHQQSGPDLGGCGKRALHEPESRSLAEVEDISPADRTVYAFSWSSSSLGIFQIARVKALGEPAVELGEHRARFVALALSGEQSRETHRRAQFQ